MRFKQANDYYCGPACLRIVEYIMFSGKKPRSQKYWAKVAGTTKNGTSIAGLKRALGSMNVQYEIVKGKQDLLEMEGLWIVWDKVRDHWMVLFRELNHGWHQTLYDPLTNKTQWGAWVERDFMNHKDAYALRLF